MPIRPPIITRSTPSRPVLVLGRGTAVSACVGIAVLSLWSAASAWYIGARDDIAQRVFVHEAETSYGYQDRIKTLQDQLEREITRNLVERDDVSGRLERLASRQAIIEARQAWLARISDKAMPTDAPPGIGSSAPWLLDAPTTRTGDAGLGKPHPVPEPFALRLRGGNDGVDRETNVAAPPRDRVSLIEGSLEGIEAAELALAGRLRRGLDDRMGRIRAALASTGIDVDRLAAPGAVGGPLVPLPEDRTSGGGFGPLAAALESGYGDYTRLLGVARQLPFGRPLAGELDQTSPFGYRYDPFTRLPALHTGVDLRAEWGAAIRATAAGKVTVAEATGGYGNMVEIDHGAGFATRYGHLSAFLVSPGDRVEAGQVIARAGSTGRSTGAHLHYETRINGEPVDPTRFLQAGSRIAELSPPR